MPIFSVVWRCSAKGLDMKDLYFSGEQDKLNGIVKGCIEVLNRPLINVSRVNSLRYKIASQNGCFVLFVDGVESLGQGKNVRGADYLEFGNTRIRTVYADSKLVKELNNTVLKKYNECVHKINQRQYF